MAKDQTDKLEKKKLELEQQLGQIQGELDHTIDQVREDMNTKLDPKTIIKKYPLPIVGGAALIGFILGHKRNSSGKSSAGNVSGALLAELKKLATRKAISFATDYVEEMLEEKADEHLPSTSSER